MRKSPLNLRKNLRLLASREKAAHEPSTARTAARVRLGLACLATLGVALGLFETSAAWSWQQWTLALATGSALAASLLRPLAPPPSADLPHGLGHPLSVTAAAWILFRLAAHTGAPAILIPAGAVAWLAATRPPATAILCLLAATGAETALTLSGHQAGGALAAQLLAYGAVAGAATVLRRKGSAPRASAETPPTEATAPGSPHAPLLSALNAQAHAEPEATNQRPLAEELAETLKLQLELLRQSFELTTVAVLLPDSLGRVLRLHCAASTRTDLVPGPFPIGTGITGAFLGPQNEVALAPAGAQSAALPYYPQKAETGAILALRIPDAENNTLRILCVDRRDPSPWKETERQALRLAADKLCRDLGLGLRIEQMNRERSAVQQVCVGLKELNGVLGLETAFDAAIKAVRALVPADFVAISMIEEDNHRTVRAEGVSAEKLQGRTFPLHQGLVGQAMKFRSTLPDRGEYRGSIPVFCSDHLFNGYRSLLIIPLQREEGEALGALTVAARKPGLFTRSLREILEVIAGQVAIKIDLAQSHEQINKLATTDGLTGLTNHRAFQHGFDVMLSRARRRKSSLCLLLCDVDSFKGINDTFGHPFGDKVLRGVAATMADTARLVDLVARYGGEEFAIVLEDSEEGGGRQLGERIRQRVESMEFLHEGEAVTVSLSLGLSVFPDDGRDKGELISRADKALYQAKCRGRNRSVAWSELARENLPRKEMEGGLLPQSPPA